MALKGIKFNGETLEVPSKTSDLENDSNFVSDSDYVHTDNNYTTEEKNKLAGIAEGAEVNTIEQISINGVPQEISSRTVNLVIPDTDTSSLGSKISASMDTTSYILTINLLNSSDTVLSSATIDFPLESVVVNGSYSSGILTLTLQNGTSIAIDISSIVSGLVPTTRTINGKTLESDITLTASDVGALPDTTTIPTSTSDLTNNSGFITSESDPTVPDYVKAITETDISNWNAKANVSDIPTDNSQLANGANYTSVTINSVATTTLAFDSDPQTQINDIVAQIGNIGDLLDSINGEEV